MKIALQIVLFFLAILYFYSAASDKKKGNRRFYLAGAFLNVAAIIMTICIF